MSSALKGSSTIRHFIHSDVIEIHDGIILDFYMQLSDIIITQKKNHAEGKTLSIYLSVGGPPPLLPTSSFPESLIRFHFHYKEVYPFLGCYQFALGGVV